MGVAIMSPVTHSAVIVKCSRCEALHRVAVEVRAEERVSLFGGDGNTWEVSYICPETGERSAATVAVSAPPGLKILGVSASSARMAPVGALASSEIQIEASGELLKHADVAFEEWVKASASAPREYCKARLTSCTAAVPVFFAVMKFLGAETPSVRWLAWTGVVSPILFLAAAIGFMLALRPEYAELTKGEFADWQRDRVSSMNLRIRVATWLYGLAMATAIALFVLTLALRK
jgi:hypothetical protein